MRFRSWLRFFLRFDFATKLNFVLVESGRRQEASVAAVTGEVAVLSVSQLQVLHQQRVFAYSYTAFVAFDLDLRVDDPLVS